MLTGPLRKRELLIELCGERGGRQIAEARLRANLIVVTPPGLDHDLGLSTRQEPFEAQALVAELAVEALADAVLPRLAGVDCRAWRQSLEHCARTLRYRLPPHPDLWRQQGPDPRSGPDLSGASLQPAQDQLTAGN